MRNSKRRNKLLSLPPWNMPSDPVKAVFWFIYWSLKVLVRFFWILILVGVICESIINGFVGGIFTLLVGLGVWFGLSIALLVLNVSTSISRTFADVSRMQQGFPPRRPPLHTFTEPDLDNTRIVEGTVTDLEAERRKRRKEQ